MRTTVSIRRELLTPLTHSGWALALLRPDTLTPKLDTLFSLLHSKDQTRETLKVEGLIRALQSWSSRLKHSSVVPDGYMFRVSSVSRPIQPISVTL